MCAQTISTLKSANGAQADRIAHTQSKSAASARLAQVWRTSGSHIPKYAPLPASTKFARGKRFRSICFMQNVDVTRTSRKKYIKIKRRLLYDGTKRRTAPY